MAVANPFIMSLLDWSEPNLAAQDSMFDTTTTGGRLIYRSRATKRVWEDAELCDGLHVNPSIHPPWPSLWNMSPLCLTLSKLSFPAQRPSSIHYQWIASFFPTSATHSLSSLHFPPPLSISSNLHVSFPLWQLSVFFVVFLPVPYCTYFTHR